MGFQTSIFEFYWLQQSTKTKIGRNTYQVIRFVIYLKHCHESVVYCEHLESGETLSTANDLFEPCFDHETSKTWKSEFAADNAPGHTTKVVGETLRECFLARRIRRILLLRTVTCSGRWCTDWLSDTSLISEK